jgi:hypothetical protein
MKRLFSLFSRALLVLSLCALLIPGTVVFAPSDVHAFGSLSENGTAAFMGIGIAPQKILHVSGSGPGSVPLFVRGSDSAGFIIERTPTNRWVLGVNESPTLGNGFVLSTIPTGNTSVPRLLVTPQGNVGIGTLAPVQRLQVEADNSTSIAIIGIYKDNDNEGFLGGNNSAVHGYSRTGWAGSFNGNVHISGNLTFGAAPSVSVGRIYLPGSGDIISTDSGRRYIYWNATAGTIRLYNEVNDDWCDYWWQTQKGAATAGNSGFLSADNWTDIITGIDTNGYGMEIHFGQADGTAGWCSVWLQHCGDKLVGHYIKY